MIAPALPLDESERLASLRSLNILDTLPEERFDRYTRMARRLFGVPVALISLVDSDRQWFKSRQGLSACQTPREVSFCGHTILQRRPMVIRDASRDVRFADSPLVTGSPKVSFYAGYPLRCPDGHALGTLCLIDHAPREFSADDEDLLRDLGAMVESELSALKAATTDELTGLNNRRGFLKITPHMLAASQRSGRSVTLFYIDLDHFKAINDTFGHTVGDQALQGTARILQETFRSSDVIGRLGGDEFAVLCTGADSDTIPARLAARFAAFNDRSQHPFTLRYSIGAVRFDPEQHRTVGDLMQIADRKMYAMKSSLTPQRSALR